ncbi:unnamed protein product [Closterium sp. Naga37s-1]|nr:unnamed protein product [Closterium sp. Naga37s-1]
MCPPWRCCEVEVIRLVLGREAVGVGSSGFWFVGRIGGIAVAGLAVDECVADALDAAGCAGTGFAVAGCVSIDDFRADDFAAGVLGSKGVSQLRGQQGLTAAPQGVQQRGVQQEHFREQPGREQGLTAGAQGVQQPGVDPAAGVDSNTSGSRTARRAAGGDGGIPGRVAAREEAGVPAATQDGQQPVGQQRVREAPQDGQQPVGQQNSSSPGRAEAMGMAGGNGGSPVAHGEQQPVG